MEKKILKRNENLGKTYRRPKYHSKLPEVFHQIEKIKFSKSSNKDQKQMDLQNPLEKKQHKQLSKHLHPIIKEGVKQKKKTQKQNLNPFIPFNKLFQGGVDKKIMHASNYKLNEFITLGIIKGAKNTGHVKKMLHVPTLRIFAFKEQPLGNKQSRTYLKNWIGFWQSCLTKHHPQLFTQIQGTFWNVPEVCVTIIYKYYSNESLQNLLESLGTIPQNVIKQIGLQLINALYIVNQQSDQKYKELRPSQVLFTDNFKIKLSPGISSQIGNFVNNFNKNDKKGLFDFCLGFQSKESINQLQQLGDCFKIGLLFLKAAVGSFEIFQNFEVLIQQTKKYLKEKQHRQQYCCMIHNQQKLIKNNQNRKDNALTILNYLEISYSKNFIDLLCLSMRLKSNKKNSLKDLLHHHFFLNKSKDQMITLKDLIEISRGWNCDVPFEVQRVKIFQQVKKKYLQRICNAINLILPNCSLNKQFGMCMKRILHVQSMQIKQLKKQLDLSSKQIVKKLRQAYRQVIQKQ